ncbi:unnamed protein product [Rotaria sordida]|uniref:Uncharacterized protein n=1 Tax=Rotaria sordida TaxID=392033 RepID=A0A813VRQ7_9BILA|nr:unnamed protein product [Rotaria sordida]CAF1021473.1 unnamed protein product [Rotaria sordida]
MTSIVKTELVDKYSKYVKTIRNRIVEVEFHWFQVNPRQSYRLRINGKQFNEVQKHMHSKKLLNLNFEQFTDLITPIFANDAAEFSSFVLRSTFDHLFDLNSNGFNSKKQNLLQENLRQMLGNRNKHISFQGINIPKILNGFGLNIVRKFSKQGCDIVLNGNHIDENITQTIQNEIDISKLVEQILNYFQYNNILIIDIECKRHCRASIDEFPTQK